jgi:hypothetical protein
VGAAGTFLAKAVMAMINREPPQDWQHVDRPGRLDAEGGTS